MTTIYKSDLSCFFSSGAAGAFYTNTLPQLCLSSFPISCQASVCQIHYYSKMGILLFLLLFIIVVVFTVALPTLSGIGKFEIDKNASKKKKNDDYEDESTATTSDYAGYVPPDEYDKINSEDLEAKSKRQLLKERLENVNIPISFKTDALDNHERVLRQRRFAQKSEKDDDPNEFDYDIDDLIAEEDKQRAIEYQQRLEQIRNQQGGQNKDDMLP